MSIRWKLILAIGIPLVLLLAGLLAYDFDRLRAVAYQENERRITETAERYAASFDGDFRMISQVARSTAQFLETAGRLSEPELYELLRRNVESDSLIYGSCVAYEPGLFPRAPDGARPDPGHSAWQIAEAPGLRPRPNPALFCPYVYRGPKGLLRMDVADAYDYLDPKWEWYRVPRQTGKPFWTEPFFDEGAGNVEMVTYVAPFFHEGKFAGTVNVDVRLEKLRLRTLGRFTAESGISVFVISREGRFVVAPTLRSPAETVFSLAEQEGQPVIAELGRKMMAGERGTARIPPMKNWPAQLAFFAPVPSSRWSLAGVASEADIMAPVYRRLEIRSLGGLAVIAALLVMVVAMSSWILRPVKRLDEAVKRLSTGDLEARAVGIRSRDEIGALARAFNAMVESLKEKVAQLTAETARRESVESELRVARTIQQSLLPHRFPPFPERGEFDLHAVSAPARYVGGDFFDYFFVNADTLVLVIADVSGKGVPAALLMAVTRTLIRDLAGRGCTPSEALGHANRLLLDGNDEGMFVTLFLGQYDTRLGRMVYSSAGHPPPYLVSPQRGARLFGGPTGTVLGALDSMEFAQAEAQIAPGEKLVFYTDGVPEARDEKGEFYRAERFEKFLHEHRGATVQALCADAVAAVTAFQNGHQHDDMTLLVLQRNR